MQEFGYHRPTTITELKEHPSCSGARVLAGGTDIIPKMRQGKFSAPILVDTSGINSLRFIEDQYHPIQKAFVQAGAVQCGYCTPGAVMAAKALLDHNLHPTDAEIREGLLGNLCRCTGYNKMVVAVQQVINEASNG